MDGTGTKHDDGKADLALCPRSALEAMARAFMLGEKKYGRHNFKKGLASHRLVAAAMRHLLAWEAGEEADPDSAIGGTHLGNALASIAMLIELARIGKLEDTRWVPAPAPSLEYDERNGAIRLQSQPKGNILSQHERVRTIP